ncbi:MAG: PIN domain-containing protein [Reyranella sp.]|uniref:type II toxin-antitoxin system VapC family toxin n=1 Tax=Reyranella sp. TaxID=1929291 RepID=UPI001AC1B460|nr:PIN domain-containing protein [Reyranella sp.]MBN9085923.1 PIN domain-containing protein [Reyranella sp.]
MILVDTSVWVDHLRAGDPKLATLLQANQVLTHPFVVGEIALGSLKQRRLILGALANLPHAPVARAEEVLLFIDRHSLAGTGLAYVDVHLLASAQLAAGAAILTRDKRLEATARRLGLA